MYIHSCTSVYFSSSTVVTCTCTCIYTYQHGQSLLCKDNVVSKSLQNQHKIIYSQYSCLCQSYYVAAFCNKGSFYFNLLQDASEKREAIMNQKISRRLQSMTTAPHKNKSLQNRTTKNLQPQSMTTIIPEDQTTTICNNQKLQSVV